jgi:hypothetical protein
MGVVRESGFTGWHNEETVAKFLRAYMRAHTLPETSK